MSQLDSTRIGRRRLIKLGGGAAVGVAAAAAVSGLGTRSGEHEIEANAAGLQEWGRAAGQWIPSCCNMCGGQCGIMVHVVNGVVDKIEPNNWNPNNYTNISSDWLHRYTAAGGGAAPKWQEISWQQAIDEIAAKMKALRDAGEAHKLIWFSEDHSFTHPQQDFCALYGTPNYSNHSNLCDVARKASYKLVMGDERPLMDSIQSRYIMLFGWNPLSATKWSHLPRIITHAIEKGAKLVVVDPYLSYTANKAHEWIPIRPSTDGAMALAMGNVIIRDKLYDEAFIKEWTVGFEQYAEYVKDKTPDWAEKITTVAAKTIERIAIEFATTKPQVVD